MLEHVPIENCPSYRKQINFQWFHCKTILPLDVVINEQILDHLQTLPKFKLFDCININIGLI